MAKKPLEIASLKHAEAKRKNIPTAEFESVMQAEDKSPVRVAYERRNRDLDPQLVWRGKDEQDWSDLVVQAPPLYIQEKVHPKALIDDLMRQSKERAAEKSNALPDLFADFNGLPNKAAQTEFYKHDAHWSNRMILGDSLAVMASLAEREGLRGQVQCIYIDPPYGIKFNSNFQWSTTTRDVKDGNRDHITREPEQVRAFRDTWRDGIHSYLTYLRDRLTVARDLLADTGSLFVQIGDENVHRVRALLDEVFGEECAVTEILVKKKGSQKSSFIDPVNDYILWYSKTPRSDGKLKFHSLFESRSLDSDTVDEFSRVELPSGEVVNLKGYTDASGEKLDFRAYPRRIEQEFPGARLFRPWPITNGGERAQQMDPIDFQGESTRPPRGRCWSHTSRAPDGQLSGMRRNLAAGRLVKSKTSLDFKRYLDDFPFKSISNWWDGLGGASDQVYVVQTNERIIERLLLMASDPGDLVLDPTCGSGTTAFVAEQWGRRWITIDTSRVALALARARIMGARYPYYLLADSREGQIKEGEVSGTPPKQMPTRGDIRFGFVCRRTGYITSGLIANNAEIDVIWDKWQAKLEPLRKELNVVLKQKWEEWKIPRGTEDNWPAKAKDLHKSWWEARIARQKEIDASITGKADFEYLYDRPYTDNARIRVAGPFTVESLSPHRTLAVDEQGGLVELAAAKARDYDPDGTPVRDFAQMVLENLRAAGVHQAHKADRITITPAALGADGSIYVIGYAKVRDHTTSPATVKHIAELHRFTAGGGWLWHVPLETTLDELAFGAPNILRVGNSDVVMIANGRRRGPIHETWLTAVSGDSGLVLARQKVTVATAEITSSSVDWSNLGCLFVLCGTFSTEVPDTPPEEALPYRLKRPFPSPVISTPNNGGAQLVVMSDGQNVLKGYIFTGNAFDELFRTSNQERYLTSTPLAWPNGPLMISSIANEVPEVKFVSPLPAGGSSDQHVAGPRSVAPPAALGNFRFAIVKTFGGVTIMSGAAIERSVELKGESMAAPAASRNHLFVSTAFALYTLNKANLQKAGEFSWAPRGGTSQPVIGPKGHVYAIAQNRLYIFPPSRLPGVPDADSLPDITSTSPQPLPSASGGVLADGGMPNPQSLPGIQPTDVQSLPDIQQDLPSKTYKPPVTSSGKRLFACLELDGDNCGNTQMRDVAAAFCQAQGFDRAEDLDVDSRRVTAETLDGRLCLKKKCKVFDQIVCRK